MDAIERTHIEQLLEINRAHLWELELQAAKWGDLSLPTHIKLQLDEYQQKIAELERRLSEALPQHNLPPRDYERFVGRRQELEEVRRLLLPYPKSRHHLVTIDGIGGIGKSALALETAYIFRDRYAALPAAERFDAIVWVSAKRTYLTADGILQQRQVFRTLDDLYAAIAQVLDYPAITRAPAEEQRAIVERVLGEQRILLILDNLETVDDEELLVFLRLLPDPTKAIVTTRHRIDVAYPVRLSGMPHDDALALIEQESARKEVSLAPEEREELWRRTGGVPLAIVWSIGLMGLGGSAESVLRRLGQGQSDIARFCFDESVARIRGRDAHKLLLALSLFEASVSRAMLGQVAGLGADEFGRDEGLAELLRLSLVNKEDDRFELLPLTHSFAQSEAAANAGWMEEARQRWILSLIALAQPYTNLAWRWRDRHQLRQEGMHLVTLANWCQQTARFDILLQIIPALSSYYNLTGQWAERLRVGKIGLEKARLSGDMYSIVIIESLVLSWVLNQQRRHEEAEVYIIDALNVARQIEDVSWQCEVLRRYSQTLRRCNEFDKALEYCQVALDLAKIVPESQKIYVVADVEYELGRIARDIGEWDKALMHFLAVRAVFNLDDKDPDKDPVFNVDRAWGVLSNLGFITHQLGDLDAAAQMYLQCLDFFRDIGGKGYLTTLLVRLAVLEEQQGDRMSALAYAREALAWSRRLGMRHEQAEAEALLARLGDARSG